MLPRRAFCAARSRRARLRRRSGFLRRGPYRAAAPLARAGDHGVPALHRQHLHRQGVGLRRRRPEHLQPGEFDADAIVERPGRRRDARRHPHLQAPRRLLPVAHRDHRPLGRATAPGAAARATWCATSRRRRAPARAEVRRLSFAVGPQQRRTTARPKYIEIYRAQLTELLTRYGPIFEVWHDGANGGDGFYGGAREKRTIDKRTYYDWPKHLGAGPQAAARRGDLQRRRAGRPLGRQRARHRGRPVLGRRTTRSAMDGGPASPGDVRDKESPAGTSQRHRTGCPRSATSRSVPAGSGTRRRTRGSRRRRS